jgi:hypothetical protein
MKLRKRMPYVPQSVLNNNTFLHVQSSSDTSSLVMKHGFITHNMEGGIDGMETHHNPHKNKVQECSVCGEDVFEPERCYLNKKPWHAHRGSDPSP